MKKIKIALAQTAIAWEDKEKNYKIAQNRVEEAVSHGADVIFFPEMSFTGFSMNTDITKECVKNHKSETISRMEDMAAQYGIAAGFGWVRAGSDKCENHYTVVDSAGSVISDYVKIHPFSYSGEDLKFQGGSALSGFLLHGIACSTFICYDLRFPEIFQAASRKAHVIIVPANWPAKRSLHWQALLQARAIENQVYILGVNCTGDMGGIRYAGDSCVIDANGIVRSVLHETEGTVYFELTDDVEDLRRDFPVKRDRREALYPKLQASVD